MHPTAGGVEEGLHENPRLDFLSKREQEVFFALVRGQRIVDIAEHMSVSSKSVTTYRSRLLQKLNVSTNAEVIAWATRMGLDGIQA